MNAKVNKNWKRTKESAILF